MTTLLLAVQIVVAVLLIIAIMLQHRVSGLSATFGGSGVTYVQRRGAEKVLYRLTIWLSVLFFALSIAWFFLPQ
jgi:protein translocase SecG subunit